MTIFICLASKEAFIKYNWQNGASNYYGVLLNFQILYFTYVIVPVY